MVWSKLKLLSAFRCFIFGKELTLFVNLLGVEQE